MSAKRVSVDLSQLRKSALRHTGLVGAVHAGFVQRMSLCRCPFVSLLGLGVRANAPFFLLSRNQIRSLP